VAQPELTSATDSLLLIIEATCSSYFVRDRSETKSLITRYGCIEN